MTWVSNVAYALALLVVAMQVVFGALEIFIPRWVFGRVFPSYEDTHTTPVWVETEKLARNMGLYNWFLALGLLLSVVGLLDGTTTQGEATIQHGITTQFFLLCVAAAGAFGLFSVGWSRAFLAQLGLGALTFVLYLLHA